MTIRRNRRWKAICNDFKVVFSYSRATLYFPCANTPLSHLILRLFSVLSQMMQLNTQAMTDGLGFVTRTQSKQFYFYNTYRYLVCFIPTKFFQFTGGKGVHKRNPECNSGIPNYTCWWAWQYCISSEITSVCAIPHRPHQAEGSTTSSRSMMHCRLPSRIWPRSIECMRLYFCFVSQSI